MNHALIVDDDVDFCRMLKFLVGRHGVTVDTAATLAQARARIEAARPDIVLLDLGLPDGDGLTLLRETDLVRGCEVVLITGQASAQTSAQALRHGAADYLVKPVAAEQIERLMARLLKPEPRESGLDAVREELERSGRYGELIGRSGRMQYIYEQVARVAATAIPVFIQGETGTGKERAARTIHQLGRRRGGPFVPVHCAGLAGRMGEPAQLDAGNLADSLVATAEGGTLFLDEICELSAGTQAQLVHLIETGSLQQAGTSASRRADIRLIAATAQDPAQAMATGQLRRELFYHLNVFPVQLPALRERLDDIPLLCSWMLRDIGQREGLHKRIAPAALRELAAYPWPGNLRELRGALEQAWVMAPGREITQVWLPRGQRSNAAAPGLPVSAGATVNIEAGLTLADAERVFILAALQRHGGHKERTAAALGISVKTLYNKLRAYDA